MSNMQFDNTPAPVAEKDGFEKFGVRDKENKTVLPTLLDVELEENTEYTEYVSEESKPIVITIEWVLPGMTDINSLQNVQDMLDDLCEVGTAKMTKVIELATTYEQAHTVLINRKLDVDKL